jgi:hypothetical protein
MGSGTVENPPKPRKRRESQQRQQSFYPDTVIGSHQSDAVEQHDHYIYGTPKKPA